MNQRTDTSALSVLAFEDGFDPIEERLRTTFRGTIEAVFQEELMAFWVGSATVEAKAR